MEFMCYRGSIATGLCGLEGRQIFDKFGFLLAEPAPSPLFYFLLFPERSSYASTSLPSETILKIFIDSDYI
jgi:hypothetical protein